jgi:membrane dipeptidase
MEEAGQLTPIRNNQELAASVTAWQNTTASDLPIGYVLSLEAADSQITPKYLQRAYAARTAPLVPAHYAGRYSPGTHATGGLTALGRELLGG